MYGSDDYYFQWVIEERLSTVLPLMDWSLARFATL